MTTHAAIQPSRREAAGLLAWWPVLVVVALRAALTFAVAGRYGWHRDELYYAVAGLHLQGGYVDFPPVTALLAALARVLFGWSLVGLRAFTILAGAATVIVGVLVARELGATRRAQTLAGVVMAFAPGGPRRGKEMTADLAFALELAVASRVNGRGPLTTRTASGF